MTSSSPTLITSVQRALHLLDSVGRRQRPVSAKALAREAGLALPDHLSPAPHPGP